MSNKAKVTAMKVISKPVLVPKWRFPEFRNDAGWDTTPGDELFEQINNRRAEAGLPILAITKRIRRFGTVISSSVLDPSKVVSSIPITTAFAAQRMSFFARKPSCPICSSDNTLSRTASFNS
jgi:hypothetical protein